MAKVYRKLTIFGGEGGQVWDDDVHEGIRKVFVSQDHNRITYLKFEYAKEDGKVVTSEYGKVNQPLKEFVLQYPDEHITAVEGSYRSVALCATEVITNLLFKTSKGRKSPSFGPDTFGPDAFGQKFVIEDGGKKIVGFHGRSGNAIDAIGVYFAQGSLNTSSAPYLSPVYKLDAQGGPGGRAWDDGSYDGIKSLSIGQDGYRITYLEFEYEKAGKLETRNHGVKGETKPKFVLNPDEYIESVEATYENPCMFWNVVIRSLKFTTSKGRTSFYGYDSGRKFVLEQKSRKIVGFHGKEGSAIDALGAYFAPTQPLIPPKKLPAIGGNGGVSWDDGVYDDVRRILVGQGNDGVAFVKFEYSKGKELVPGGDHGKKTLLGAEEFKLEDGEYLTAIDGYYDKVFGIEAPIITCLKFKTNKRESIPFGLDAGEKFTLGEKDHKIVGSHGQASDVVHSIGVSVVPVTTTQ